MTDTNFPGEPDALSIADAAQRLRVSERTLRRLLTLAPFAGRTIAIERQTAKGRRLTTLLPPDLLQEITDHLKTEEATTLVPQKKGSDSPPETAAPSVATVAQTLANGGDTVAGTQANSGTNTGSTSASGGNGGKDGNLPLNDGTGDSTALDLPPQAYREIITRMESEIQFLRAALVREQENVQREQTLRAMDRSTNTPASLASDTESDSSPMDGVITPPESSEGDSAAKLRESSSNISSAEPAARRGFLDWLFRR